MDTIFISFEADPELIAELATLADESKLEHSTPVPMKSPADALDAPIGAEEVKILLDVLSVSFTTASVGVVFLDKVLDLLKKHRKKATVRSPRTGRKLGVLVGKTSREEAGKILKS